MMETLVGLDANFLQSVEIKEYGPLKVAIPKDQTKQLLIEGILKEKEEWVDFLEDVKKNGGKVHGKSGSFEPLFGMVPLHTSQREVTWLIEQKGECKWVRLHRSTPKLFEERKKVLKGAGLSSSKVLVSIEGKIVISQLKVPSGSKNLISEIRDFPKDGATKLGQVLGRCHRVSAKRKCSASDQRSWNNRLKLLEGWTQANTLWRAPHTLSTHATIDLNGPGVRDWIVSSEGVIIGMVEPSQSWVEVLLPDKELPATRDIGRILLDLDRANLSHEDSKAARQVFIAGWKATAPRMWANRRVLDGHRGGISIWVYECLLIEVAEFKILGKGKSAELRERLLEVPRLERRMFLSRSISALGFCSRWLGIAMLLAPLWGMKNAILLIGLGITGLLLDRILVIVYRLRAPPPTWVGEGKGR